MSGLFAAAAVDRKTPEPAVTFAMPVLAPPQPLPSVPSSPLPGPPSAPVAKPAPKPVLVAQVRNTPAQDQLQQNQRLLVFYLDLVQMTPDDLGRAVAAAENFLRERVQEQDHITLMTHSSTTVHVDITQDRDRLVQELRRLTAPPNAAGEPPPQSNPVLIRQAIQVLAAMPDKKVILFFTHAPDNSGTREELQAAQDDAVRGKVAIYVIDTRGVVSPPK